VRQLRYFARAMKNSFALILLSLLSNQAFAATYNYTCKLQDNNQDTFGQSFTAKLKEIEAKDEISYELKLVGVENGLTVGEFDKNYHPHAVNEGSIRFGAGVDSKAGNDSGCGEAQVILKKSTAEGKGGELSIEYDCDSDGSGPSFYDYDCK